MQSRNIKNLLELIPQPRVKWEHAGDRRINLLMPRYGSGPLGRWVQKWLNPKPVYIHLDEIGSATWQLVDGRRTVYEIGKALHQQFGAKVEPVYDRLAIFLRRLEKQDLIILATR